MEFVGRVIKELPLEEGVSRAGNPWRKKCWVLETFGQYPRQVKVDLFNNGVDNVRFEMGGVYNVSVDAESREFNGRYYTDLRCYAATPAQDPTAPTYAAPAPAPGVAPQNNPFAAPASPFPAAPEMPAGAPGATAFGDSTDDLPF